MRKRKSEKLYVRVTLEQALWIGQVSASLGLTKNDFVGLILEKAMRADGSLLVIVDNKKQDSPISS